MFKVGDIIQDINPGWPDGRYLETGRVIEINGNIVTWLSYKDNKLVKDPYTDLDYFKEKSKMERKIKTMMERHRDMRKNSSSMRRYINELNRKGYDVPVRTSIHDDEWFVKNMGLKYLTSLNLDSHPKGVNGLSDLKKSLFLGVGLVNKKDTRFDELLEILHQINESEDYDFLKKTLINFHSNITRLNVKLKLNGECDGFDKSCNNIKVDYSNIKNTLLKYDFDVNFIPVRTINEYLTYVSDQERNRINKKISEYLNNRTTKNMLQEEVIYNMSRNNWYFDWGNDDVHAIMSIVLIISMIESNYKFRRISNGK